MEENYNVNVEARKQYLKYFKGWFLVLGILMVVFLIKVILGIVIKEDNVPRTNLNAPQERVYDEANVLSDDEEERLRTLIAETEAKIHCDIVVWTIKQPVEGSEAQKEYGYRYNNWDLNMRDLSDDFFDYNGYGYDNLDYDGALLLDNWYEGQSGSWLSTSGAVYEKFGNNEINRVLDEVYYSIQDGKSPYEAYVAGIKMIAKLMNHKEGLIELEMGSFVLGALVVPLIVAAVFIAVNLKSKEGTVTTTSNTYVNGNPKMNRVSDDFIRKSVSSRVIQSSSGSGRSGGSGGRGGSHRSSSGRSYGGGGRRR